MSRDLCSVWCCLVFECFALNILLYLFYLIIYFTIMCAIHCFHCGKKGHLISNCWRRPTTSNASSMNWRNDMYLKNDHVYYANGVQIFEEDRAECCVEEVHQEERSGEKGDDESIIISVEERSDEKEGECIHISDEDFYHLMSCKNENDFWSQIDDIDHNTENVGADSYYIVKRGVVISALRYFCFNPD